MALAGYQAKREEVVQKMADIKRQLGAGAAPVAVRKGGGKRKRKMSAAGRKAIAEAQRKRWAVSKKSTEPTATPEAPKAKPRLSKAGRAAIIAGTKKRWALIHAEAKKAATKKTVTKVAAGVAGKAAPKKSPRTKATNGKRGKAAKKPGPPASQPTADVVAQ
jgi:hypothetical protein